MSRIVPRKLAIIIVNTAIKAAEIDASGCLPCRHQVHVLLSLINVICASCQSVTHIYKPPRPLGLFLTIVENISTTNSAILLFVLQTDRTPVSSLPPPFPLFITRTRVLKCHISKHISAQTCLSPPHFLHRSGDSF